MHDVTLCVATDLNFYMSRTFEVVFEIQARVTKRAERLRGGIAPRGGQPGLSLHQSHTFSAAARDGLEQYRVAKFPCAAFSIFEALNWILNAGNQGHADTRGKLPRSGF